MLGIYRSKPPLVDEHVFPPTGFAVACTAARYKGSGLKILFCQKTYFWPSTIKKILQCAYCNINILGRNYLCANNRCIIFSRFITQNNTIHHLCKNLYLEYAMQNKSSNFYIREVLLTMACMYQITVKPISV